MVVAIYRTLAWVNDSKCSSRARSKDPDLAVRDPSIDDARCTIKPLNTKE